MIISLINQKGGVGKTTLSLNLASAFAEDGKNVVLIDADYQATARKWAKDRKERKMLKKFQIYAIDGPDIHDYVEMMREEHEISVIDSPAGRGEDERMARTIMLASDLILIPIRPTKRDLESAQTIIKRFKEVREKFKPEIKAAYVLNCIRKNHRVGRETAELLLKQSMPVMKTKIPDRGSIEWTYHNGYSVFDLKKEENRKGAEEFRALKNEIIEVMGHD